MLYLTAHQVTILTLTSNESPMLINSISIKFNQFILIDSLFRPQLGPRFNCCSSISRSRFMRCLSRTAAWGNKCCRFTVRGIYQEHTKSRVIKKIYRNESRIKQPPLTSAGDRKGERRLSNLPMSVNDSAILDPYRHP